MSRSNFGITDRVSRHLGTKANVTSLSWEEWRKLYEPTACKVLVLTTQVNAKGDKIITHTVESDFYATQAFEDSISKLISTCCGATSNKDLILLSANWPMNDANTTARDERPNSFLNNMIAIPKERGKEAAHKRWFSTGYVGEGLFEWLKLFVMSACDASNEEDRKTFQHRFRDLTKFIRSLAAKHPAKYDNWFSTLRTRVENTTAPDDVLCPLLAYGVLGHQRNLPNDQWKMPRSQLARWFELSMVRTVNHEQDIRKGIIGLIVWLYVTAILKNEPDVKAMNNAFDLILDTASGPDVREIDLFRMMLANIFPELLPYAIDFLASIKAASRKTKVFVPPEDVAFNDGTQWLSSTVRATDAGAPNKVGCVDGGTLTVLEANTYQVSVRDVGMFSCFWYRRDNKENKTTIKVLMTPFNSSAVGGRGRRLLVRTGREIPKKGDSFQGVMGPTVSEESGGAIGDGKYAPIKKMQAPVQFLNTDSMTIIFEASKITLFHENSWNDMPFVTDITTEPICAIYAKGMRITCIVVKEETERLVAAAATAAASVRTAFTTDHDDDDEEKGVSLSQMQPPIRRSIANLLANLSV